MGNLRQHVHRKRKERERKRSRKNSRKKFKKEGESEAVKGIERKSSVFTSENVLSEIRTKLPDESKRVDVSKIAPKPPSFEESKLLTETPSRDRAKNVKRIRNAINKERVRISKKERRSKILRRATENGVTIESGEAFDDSQRDEGSVTCSVGSLAARKKNQAPTKVRPAVDCEEAARVNDVPTTSFASGPTNKALQKMRVAQFRMINEMLYTSQSEKAAQLFKEDRKNFDVYHEGYRQQVGKWLMNPLDKVISEIKGSFPRSTRIADLGCGEARLAAVLKPQGFTVYSFDLVAANAHVQACNIRNLPLGPESVDVAVMCLSLMGTDMGQFVLEANRILVSSGHLLVAEVESRIPSVDAFMKIMKRYGFILKSKDTARVFHFFNFKKAKAMPKGAEKNMDKVLWLKPCLYKKR